MKTSVTPLDDDAKVELKVEIPAEDVAREIDAQWASLAGSVKIPGFRKGKVPRPVLEQHVGKDAPVFKAIQELVPRAYPVAADEAGVRPIDVPEVTIDDYEEGAPLVFVATVPIEPEGEIDAYEGIEVTVPPSQATEKEIQGEVEALRERLSKLEPVEGRSVESGDFVLIDFTGHLDDVPFDGGSGTDFLLEVGSERFLPGFEDGLIGAVAGEDRQVWIDVPDDYHGTQIAGKRVRFDATVKEIKTKRLPDVDDTFASEVSEHDTLLELRSAIRARIEDGREREAKMRAQSQILDWLQSNVKVEVPPPMIDAKRDDLLRDFLAMVQSQGMSLDDYFRLSDSNADELKENMEREALRRVREELALDAVARREGIQASHEDVDKDIDEVARRAQQTPAAVRENLASRGHMGDLSRAITRRKTLEWLSERANVTVKEEEPTDE